MGGLDLNLCLAVVGVCSKDPDVHTRLTVHQDRNSATTIPAAIFATATASAAADRHHLMPEGGDEIPIKTQPGRVLVPEPQYSSAWSSTSHTEREAFR